MKKIKRSTKRRNFIGIKGILTFTMLLILLFMPFLLWSLKKNTPISALIIDKTVPDFNFREHKGLFWILNHKKYINIDTDKAFDFRKDYYGFFPGKDQEYTIKELPDNLNNLDLIYLTDTYGVYEEDFAKENTYGERSGKIYGGLQKGEISKIKSALKDNIIISEFNTLASPTTSEVRSEMEDILGIEWSGWIGRFFSNLSKDNTEIPRWLIENYEVQYLQKWEFKGSGFAFVKDDDTVIILRSGEEIDKRTVTIKFSKEALEEFGVKNNVRYNYWFDIVNLQEGTDLLATYSIDLTEKGKQSLMEFGVPLSFPAVTRKTGNYTSYYFAGDFVDNNRIPNIYNLEGLPLINKLTAVKSDPEQNYFFWRVYYPLMETILNNIRNK